MLGVLIAVLLNRTRFGRHIYAVGGNPEAAILAALVIGLTACSAEMSNNYRFKPIGFEIT